MHQSLVQPSAFLCLSALAIGTHGCGSDPYQTAEVTGTVTCNGQPAHGGVIRFRPVDAPNETGRPPGEPGRPAYATVAEDGTFRMMTDTATKIHGQSGALLGPHDVLFEAPRTEPIPIHEEDRENLSEEELKELQAELDAMGVYDPLPCGTTITPNTVEVVAGENEFAFTLGPN